MEKIIEKLKTRAAHCKRREFLKADAIRDALKIQGVELYDLKDKEDPGNKEAVKTAWKIGKRGEVKFLPWAGL